MLGHYFSPLSFFNSIPLRVMCVWGKSMENKWVSVSESVSVILPFVWLLPEIILSYKETFKAKLWRSNSYFFYVMVYCKSVIFCKFSPFLFVIPPPSFFLHPSFCPFFSFNKYLLSFCYVPSDILCVRDIMENKTSIYSIRDSKED